MNGTTLELDRSECVLLSDVFDSLCVHQEQLTLSELSLKVSQDLRGRLSPGLLRNYYIPYLQEISKC